MQKRIVIVLLIIAIILSIFSLVVIMSSNNAGNLQNNPEISTEGVRGSGTVGFVISPPGRE